MKDYLVKALGYDGTVRAYAISSTNTVQEAATRQGSSRTVTAALGRSLTAGVMMGAMLKGEEKITIKIEGNGPASPIVIDANSKGQVRGYVKNPQVEADRKVNGKLNVSAVVGESGSLSVVKDLGLKDFFTGSVPLVSGEIAEDFTYYFARSEQTPSSVALGVHFEEGEKVAAAGGFILQMMPGVTDETIEDLEEKLKSLPPVSQLIKEGLSPEEILQRVIGTNQLQILDTLDVEFKCNCSRERISNGIIGLGSAEIKEMIAEDGGAETQCHFCNEIYNFSKDDLENLLKETK